MLNENKFLLAALTRACKLKNDRVRTKLPIQKDLLRMILSATQTYFENKQQIYLSVTYQALFSTSYFGLFRIGELTTGDHPVRVADVQIGENKNKMLFILRTCNTHTRGDKPQQIKISSKRIMEDDLQQKNNPECPCPFQLLKLYLSMRPLFLDLNEPFFVFGDRTPIKTSNMSATLKKMIKKVDLDPKFYSVTSLRSGHACDLLKLQISVETIKKIGRWRSSAVYNYLKC